MFANNVWFPIIKLWEMNGNNVKWEVADARRTQCANRISVGILYSIRIWEIGLQLNLRAFHTIPKRQGRYIVIENRIPWIPPVFIFRFMLHICCWHIECEVWSRQSTPQWWLLVTKANKMYTTQKCRVTFDNDDRPTKCNSIRFRVRSSSIPPAPPPPPSHTLDFHAAITSHHVALLCRESSLHSDGNSNFEIPQTTENFVGGDSMVCTPNWRKNVIEKSANKCGFWVFDQLRCWWWGNRIAIQEGIVQLYAGGVSDGHHLPLIVERLWLITQ